MKKDQLNEEELWDREVRRFGIWVRRKLRDSKPTDLTMAATSVLLLIVSVFQGIIAWENFNASSPLTDYARRSTEASERFAESADSIRIGVANAGSQLGNQASSLHSTVGETGRMAAASEEANKNFLASDRPWVGGLITVTDFEDGKKPTFLFQFVNTGKRPAHILRTEAAFGLYNEFPDPEKEYSIWKEKNAPATLSTTVIVPGIQSNAKLAAETMMPEGSMSLLRGRFVKYFAFAIVDYQDPRTLELHHTQLCMVYEPSQLPSPMTSSFLNCHEYNDAN